MTVRGEIVCLPPITVQLCRDESV